MWNLFWCSDLCDIKSENNSCPRKRLGKTANGNWVNLGYLKTITEQGYEEKLAAVALR